MKIYNMNWYQKQLYLEASRKLPTIGYRELSKFMQALGYEHVSTKGDHQKWKQNNTGQVVTIVAPSAWGSNSKNILEYILKGMGVAPKDFAALWKRKDFRQNPAAYIDVNQFNPSSDTQNLIRTFDENKPRPEESQPQQLDPNLQADPNDPHDWRQWLKHKPNK